MSATTCGRCRKNLRPGPRYRVEPLAALARLTVPAVCRLLGVSGTTEVDARCHGMTRQMADRAAVRLGEHPYLVWPEMRDHDLAVQMRPCAACPDLFVPTDRGHIYCSRACKDRAYHRRRRGDPAWRERERRRAARAYRETRDYRLRWQRAYDQSRRGAA